MPAVPARDRSCSFSRTRLVPASCCLFLKQNTKRPGLDVEVESWVVVRAVETRLRCRIGVLVAQSPREACMSSLTWPAPCRARTATSTAGVQCLRRGPAQSRDHGSLQGPAIPARALGPRNWSRPSLCGVEWFDQVTPAAFKAERAAAGVESGSACRYAPIASAKPSLAELATLSLERASTGRGLTGCDHLVGFWCPRGRSWEGFMHSARAPSLELRLGAGV